MANKKVLAEADKRPSFDMDLQQKEAKNRQIPQPPNAIVHNNPAFTITRDLP